MRTSHQGSNAATVEAGAHPQILVTFVKDARPGDYHRVANVILERKTTAEIKEDIASFMDPRDVLDLLLGQRPRGGRTTLKCREPGPDMDNLVRELSDCAAVQEVKTEI
jgi:hypothetical protein